MTSQSSQRSHLDTVLPSVSPDHPKCILHLRTILPSDAQAWSSLVFLENTDPAAKPIDIPTAESIIARQRESAATPTILDSQGKVLSGPSRVNMVLALKSLPSGPDDKVIGLGGFGAIKDEERDGRKIRVGDVGVLIDPEYRRQGYAVEAMKLAIDWGFLGDNGPMLDLISITTLEDNVAMRRLVDEKLGLKRLGIARPAEFDETKQEIYYEITVDDWQDIAISHLRQHQ